MVRSKIFVAFDAAEEGGIREAQLVTADGRREELVAAIFDDGETVTVELTAADEVVAAFSWDGDAEAVQDLEASVDGAEIFFKNLGRTEIAVNGCLLRSGERGKITPVNPDMALRAAGWI